MSTPAVNFNELNVVAIIRSLNISKHDITEISYRNHENRINAIHAKCTLEEHNLLVSEFKEFISRKIDE